MCVCVCVCFPGGRRAYDKVTAANSYHGKYFTSVDYTADGTCVVAAGHSKFVCIYECSQQILVKKFQVYIVSMELCTHLGSVWISRKSHTVVCD